jgi:hypothetical protein
MHQPRKIGGPQLSYNNNFTRAITAILPNIQSENQGLRFKEWILIALNPNGLNVSMTTLNHAKQWTKTEKIKRMATT